MVTERVMEIRWNGQLLELRNLTKSIKDTINHVETSIQNGIRDGMKKTIQIGQNAARDVITREDAIGPHAILLNSIRSSIKGRDDFYLLAGYGDHGDDRYPLLIEKGFPKHWKSADDPRFREWLQYRGLLINRKTGKEIAGMMVGTRPKWRKGIGFMNTAFLEMNSKINRIIINSIIERIRKSTFK